MDVEAVGIVKELIAPTAIPPQYETVEKYVVSVVWIKVFPELLTFTSENYKLGDTKTKTIFEITFEKDKEILDRIFDSLRYK